MTNIGTADENVEGGFRCWVVIFPIFHFLGLQQRSSVHTVLLSFIKTIRNHFPPPITTPPLCHQNFPGNFTEL